jgi:hypothetical protein
VELSTGNQGSPRWKRLGWAQFPTSNDAKSFGFHPALSHGKGRQELSIFHNHNGRQPRSIASRSIPSRRQKLSQLRTALDTNKWKMGESKHNRTAE